MRMGKRSTRLTGLQAGNNTQKAVKAIKALEQDCLWQSLIGNQKNFMQTSKIAYKF